MTHDELLKVIIHGQTMNYEWRNALRAVVELHKPKEVSEYPKGFFACEECSKWGYENMFVMLPCPTIQAIEKELG